MFKKKIIAGLIIVLAFAAPVSAWGPSDDVVITNSVTLPASSELGVNYDFATLTVNSGGSLTASRLYQGYGAGDTVTVNVGGTLHLTSLATIGYDYDSTFNQNGGTVQVDNWLGVGRTSGTYNMAGGLLLLNDDDSTPTATGVLYMPPKAGGYTGGTMNFSDGTIEIHRENWSSSGYDIASQTWWNDLTAGGATITWDGSVTIISSSVSITITEPGGSTEVLEGGVPDSYEIELSEEPSANVTITATPGDSEIDIGEGAGVPKTLTFTTSNWNTAQTITVNANNDTVYEGGPGGTPHITTISHSAQQTGGGGEYNGISISDVPVSVIDDELGCGDWGYEPADFNLDCYVNLFDFADLALHWLEG